MWVRRCLQKVINSMAKSAFGRTWHRLQHRLYFFAEIVIGDAEDSRVFYLGMRDQ
jgi:hypothetical protein